MNSLSHKNYLYCMKRTPNELKREKQKTARITKSSRFLGVMKLLQKCRWPSIYCSWHSLHRNLIEISLMWLKWPAYHFLHNHFGQKSAEKSAPILKSCVQIANSRRFMEDINFIRFHKHLAHLAEEQPILSFSLTHIFFSLSCAWKIIHSIYFA